MMGSMPRIQCGAKAVLGVLENQDKRLARVGPEGCSGFLINFRVRLGTVNLISADDYRKIAPDAAALELFSGSLLAGGKWLLPGQSLLFSGKPSAPAGLFSLEHLLPPGFFCFLPGRSVRKFIKGELLSIYAFEIFFSALEIHAQGVIDVVT